MDFGNLGVFDVRGFVDLLIWVLTCFCLLISWIWLLCSFVVCFW